ncbi:hypothetical protein FACS189485_23320 [Spirochaetia bacterium]|nr:hypothetical protein FACS189485_23320 [Spirochaetia bacterium]
MGERGEPLKSPLLSLIEQREEFNPAGSDISGGQSKTKLARVPVSAMMAD